LLTFASIFAGLGLFFVGIRLMTGHLKQLAGPRMRRMLTRALSSHTQSAVFGFGAGAIIQSVNAVAFLMMALVSAGALQAKRAFPIIAWANLGTSVIVVVAALNLHLLVLLLLGITGFAYYLNLDQSARYRHLVGALLGIGMLFLGIDLVKIGALPLKEAAWLREYIAASSGHFAFGFVIGLLVTLVAQSSTTVTLVSMAMVAAGILRVDTGAMIIIGAGLGSGISALMMAGSLTGSPRQLLMFQFVLKCCGSTAMLLLISIEFIAGVPLLAALLRWLGLGPTGTLAAIYLTMQVLADVVVHFAGGPLMKLVEKTAPPSVEEVLGKPHFLQDHALDEPQSALMLVDREQQLLLSRLPAYLDPLREEITTEGPSTATRRAADGNIVRLCDQFLRELADRNHSREVLESSIVLRDRNELIASLQETLNEINSVASADHSGTRLGALVGNLVEGLHMMLESLSHAAGGFDAEDLALLRALTHDRSDLMDSIRRRVLESDPSMSPDTRRMLFSVTTLFERAVWLLRRYVLLLDQTPQRSG
jgi:phosphate:Na+ symporter